MLVNYDPALTMSDARSVYFDANQFGVDGGYSKKWVDLKLGFIPMPLPNTAARVRAVRYHDLHHVLTGYDTDWIGEFEISAWELATGCKDMYAAWVLNTLGLAAGVLVAPRRMFRAWVRGRHSQNLYGAGEFDPLLSRHVGELRESLGTEQARAAKPTAGDVSSFAAYTAVALASGPFAVAALPLVIAGAAVLNAVRAFSGE